MLLATCRQDEALPCEYVRRMTSMSSYVRVLCGVTHHIVITMFLPRQRALRLASRLLYMRMSIGHARMSFGHAMHFSLSERRISGFLGSYIP